MKHLFRCTGGVGARLITTLAKPEATAQMRRGSAEQQGAPPPPKTKSVETSQAKKEEPKPTRHNSSGSTTTPMRAHQHRREAESTPTKNLPPSTRRASRCRSGKHHPKGTKAQAKKKQNHQNAQHAQHAPEEREHRQRNADEQHPNVALPDERVAGRGGRLGHRREAQERSVRRHPRGSEKVPLAAGQLEKGHRLTREGCKRRGLQGRGGGERRGEDDFVMVSAFRGNKGRREHGVNRFWKIVTTEKTNSGMTQIGATRVGPAAIS